MKCTNSDCNRSIGLTAHRRWLSKRPYCSKKCRDAVRWYAMPRKGVQNSGSVAVNIQARRVLKIIEGLSNALGGGFKQTLGSKG
jgi:hypothetical protein